VKGVFISVLTLSSTSALGSPVLSGRPKLRDWQQSVSIVKAYLGKHKTHEARMVCLHQDLERVMILQLKMTTRPSPILQ